MLEGVADEVGEDDVEAARVEPGVDAALGVQVHGVQPGAGVEARGDLVGEVDVVQDQPGGARVEAGDLHQVLDEVAEPLGLADDEAYGGLDHRVHAAGLGVEFLFEHLHHRRDRGQRGAQLVRHVGDEPARGVVPGGHVGDPLLQRLGGLVERPCQLGEFIGTGDPEPGVQLALAEPARGDAEPVHGLEDGRRGGLREQRGTDQREPGGDTQRPGEGVEVLRLRLKGLEHVAGRPAADHPGPGHQIRRAVLGDPLPVQVVRLLVAVGHRLLLVHRRPQRLGHVLQRKAVQAARVAVDRLVVRVLADEQDAEALAAVGHLARRAHQFVLRGVHRQRAGAVLHLLAEVAQDGVLGAGEDGLAVEPVRDAGRGHGGGQRDQAEDHDQPEAQTGEPQPPQNSLTTRAPAADPPGASVTEASPGGSRRRARYG